MTRQEMYRDGKRLDGPDAARVQQLGPAWSMSLRKRRAWLAMFRAMVARKAAA